MATRHSIIGLVEILKWMEQQGFSRESILLGTGIDDARLENTNETLSPEQELRFYSNLLRISDNPNVLLEAGFKLKLATYGIWGLALISSPTVRKAIELGIQFVDFTYTYNTIIFFEEDDTAGIRITKAQELNELERPMIERDISAVYVLLQHLIQQDQPVEEICLSWPSDRQQDPDHHSNSANSSSNSNSNQEYYQALFGCPVRFDECATELRFSKDCLDLELPQHNALALQLCMNQLEQTRSSLDTEGHSTDDSEGSDLNSSKKSTSESVRYYLSSTPLYRASMESCAQAMNMSSRNLRRKLEKECTSYQSILDEFRYALSDKYLSDTDMTLNDIAERLGYSDAANFSHAYKRWSGFAPRCSHH